MTTNLTKAVSGKKVTVSNIMIKKGTTTSPSAGAGGGKKKLSVNKTKKKLTSSVAKAVGGKKGAVSNIAINNYLFYGII